jgi:adenosylhomocysteinase
MATNREADLVNSGKKSWEWALSRMNIIREILDDFENKRPLEGVKIGISLHITKETSVLCLAASRLGAKIVLCAANPMSSQDEIAAFLKSKGVQVFGWKNESLKEYTENMVSVLEEKPDIITDDGANLHVLYHSRENGCVIGGTEETTSGVQRLKLMEEERTLRYPVIAVNNAPTKYLFDNHYGTGQSTIEAIMQITNILLAGKQVVVCGYGPVGKGVAIRAKGMGAIVTITEINPIRALEANMDGFDVRKLNDVLKKGDLFITCTGQTHVITNSSFEKIKSGAILANAGHFDVEIDSNSLYSNADKIYLVRQHMECFEIYDKKIYLLCNGRVANLVGSEGNSPEVMSMSFANQLLSIIHISKNYCNLKNTVVSVPMEIDKFVAYSALSSLGIEIDELSEAQRKYQSLRK